MARRDDPDVVEPEADAPPAWLMRFVQAALVLAGLLGAALHAFPLKIGDEHQNWPNFDVVTIAWLGLAAVGAWLPNVSEIGWGEFSLKTKRLRQASSIYETSLENFANLVQNWSTSAALYLNSMERDESELLELKAKIYADYVRDRMGEAYEMLATKPGVNLRLGLWLFDPIKEEIVFVYGFRLKPKVTSYKPGVGMIGKAFVENRHFNEADVRKVPSYESSRDTEEPPYRGVLCEPVRWGNEAIGIITVDRSTAGYFDYISEQVAQGLAAQCALAIRVYEREGESETD